MYMKKKFLTLLALACCFCGVRADEGMWMLSHVSPKSMKIMKDLGLEMSKKELYNTKGTSLKDAVVSFGGFCSGVNVALRKPWCALHPLRLCQAT